MESKSKKAIIKKRFFQVLKGLMLFLTLYFLAIFVLPHITFKGKDKSKEVSCYLKSNGSHVDIVMPINTVDFDWLQYLSLEHIEHRDSVYKWVAFGWGDKNFYLNTPTWGDLTFSTAFKAAFWLGSGAIHVTYYQEIQESDKCVAFYISRKQSLALQQFILHDFVKSDKGMPLYITTNMNYGPRDCFYESKKKYSLFHTCNTWVNDALKSAQSKHCLWTALEFGVMDLYQTQN